MNLTNILKSGVFAALGMAGTGPALAEVLTLAPAADTYLRSDTPDTTQGSNALLLVGDTTTVNSAMRALLSFDLAASLPAGAVIRGVSLRLSVESVDKESGDADETLQLYPLLENFTEGAATWLRRNSGKFWTRPGGTSAPGEPLATATANPVRVRGGQAVVFESGALTAAVKEKAAGRLDLLVKLAREDSRRSVFRFGSSRSKNRTPSLVIEYDNPGNVSGVIPVPGHPERPVSANYKLTVGGRAVDVRAERFNFDVGMVEIPEAGATVEVELGRDFADYSLKPARHGIAATRDGRRLTFQLSEPHKLVLQVEGLPPLAIIATPVDAPAPHRDDPNVLYFPPGVTVAGIIRPLSGQTIYLAPGALVKGRIEAKNVTDVTVRGRGLLETAGYSVREEKTHGILFENSRRITVEGIGLRAHYTWWQTLFLNSRDITVSQMNLFGLGVNTDGIDIDGVRDFVVRDTFIRAEDDGLGWHSLDAEANGEAVTERARADNIVIWNTGAGNGIRIGASMETQLWRDILIENVDILMHKENGIYSDYSDWAWTEDLTFRNITIEKPSTPIAFKIEKTRYSNATGFLDERGHIERLVFENVTMNGGRILLAGHGPNHRIDQVWFNNCVNAGVPVAALSDLTVNAHVSGVRFNQIVTPRAEPAPGRFEAEYLESSTNTRPQITYAEDSLSNGKARLLKASAADDYVDYAIEGLAAGVYRLKVGVKRTPASGRFQLSVSGVKVSGERDLFASTSDVQTLDFGDVVLKAADAHSVRLLVTGKNPSSAGHQLDIDFIELTPTSA